MRSQQQKCTLCTIHCLLHKLLLHLQLHISCRSRQSVWIILPALHIPFCRPMPAETLYMKINAELEPATSLHRPLNSKVFKIDDCARGHRKQMCHIAIYCNSAIFNPKVLALSPTFQPLVFLPSNKDSHLPLCFCIAACCQQIETAIKYFFIQFLLGIKIIDCLGNNNACQHRCFVLTCTF